MEKHLNSQNSEGLKVGLKTRKGKTNHGVIEDILFDQRKHRKRDRIQIPLTNHTPQRHFTSLHLSHSLVDRWGTKDDRATTVLHSSLFSVFRRASPNFNPVHSVTLSSHLFFCLPLLLPPCTVPCRIIFASPVDLVLCPYYLSFRFFTVVRRSS